ncbi:MAG: FHA domain-containing protein, partial [Planctomycetota bacterium]
MIKLLVKFGDESKEIEFHEAEISIGRATDNVLPLQDKKSSRKHAKIEKVNGEYLVNDLGSGNGTKVNGKDVNTHVLSKGDEICIGLTTMFVLTVDSPAKPAAVAPPPAAVAAAPPPPPPAPAPRPATIRASADSMDEARRKITRRGLAAKKSDGWVGTAASILVLIGISAGGYYLYDKHEKESEVKRQAREAQEYQSTAKYREAEADFRKFSKAAEADPVEDSIITEATTYAEKHAALYPEWDNLVARLKQRRNEQIGRDDLASVDARIQAALRDRRFADALQALKDLKANTESSAAGNLVAKVCDSINQEFKSIDDYGRKLAEEKKYTIAADHYKLQAPRFKGTEHYRYLTYKPETLEQLKKAEAETATAKANKTPEPDTTL